MCLSNLSGGFKPHAMPEIGTNFQQQFKTNCDTTSDGHFVCADRQQREGNGSILMITEGHMHTVVVTKDNLLCCRGLHGCANPKESDSSRMHCVSDVEERPAVLDKPERSSAAHHELLIPFLAVTVIFTLTVIPMVYIMLHRQSVESLLDQL
jgi:hypothetical protein